MPTNQTEAALVEALMRYKTGRGAHDNHCCSHRLGYGCNCRQAEWDLPFRAGWAAAMRAHAHAEPSAGVEVLYKPLDIKATVVGPAVEVEWTDGSRACVKLCNVTALSSPVEKQG